MDKETTQRLLKESIIFLCRTHIGDAASFEVDGIICLSTDSGPIQQQVVFKVHELITEKFDDQPTLAPVGGYWPDALSAHGIGGSLLKRSLAAPRCRKRKADDLVPIISGSTTIPGSCRGFEDGAGDMTSMSENYSEVKAEPLWTNENGIDVYQNGEMAESLAGEKTRRTTLPEKTNSLRLSCDSCSFVCTSETTLKTHFDSVHKAGNLSERGQLKRADMERVDSEIDDVITNETALVSSDLRECGIACEPMKETNSNDLGRIAAIGSSPPFPIKPRCRQLARGSQATATRTQSVCSPDQSSSSAPIKVEDDSSSTPLAATSENSCPADVIALDQSAPRHCATCGLDFADFPTFNVHCTEAHERYACPECTKTFASQAVRDRHLFEHTGEQPYDCAECELLFSRPDSLRKHRMKVHSSLATAAMDDGLFRSEVGSSIDFEYGPSLAASRTRESTSSRIDAVGALQLYQDPYLADMQSLTDGWLQNPEMSAGCSQSALSSDAIEILSDDEGSGMFDGGTQFYNMRGGWMATTTIDHSRTFYCDICRDAAHGSEAFREHCDVMHRRVPCLYCGRTFTQKASMERHQRQHTGERPYRCPYCELSYTRKENLHTHVTRAHPLVAQVE